MRRDLGDQREVAGEREEKRGEERRRRRRLVLPKFLSQRDLCPVLSSRPSPMSVYWLATSVFHFSLAIALG